MIFFFIWQSGLLSSNKNKDSSSTLTPKTEGKATAAAAGPPAKKVRGGQPKKVERPFSEKILLLRCLCEHGPATETYKDEEYEGRCKACKRCICLLCGLTLHNLSRTRDFLPHLESHNPAYPPTEKEIEENNRVANKVCTNNKCKAVGSYGPTQRRTSTRCKMVNCKMYRCNQCEFTTMSGETLQKHIFRNHKHPVRTRKH